MSLEMLQQIHDTLREHDAPVCRELAAEMDRLWRNPSEYETAAGDWEKHHGESFIEDADTHLVFHLGVGFGIEYERQYPTDGNAEWPDPEPIQEVNPEP